VAHHYAAARSSSPRRALGFDLDGGSWSAKRRWATNYCSPSLGCRFELPPQQARSRLQLLFRRFLGVFARPEHPLTLFLDDLQWLDPATLDVLADLLTHTDIQRLLLIGAYRDNEVAPWASIARSPGVV
jgi:hypothetical protein